MNWKIKTEYGRGVNEEETRRGGLRSNRWEKLLGGDYGDWKRRNMRREVGSSSSDRRRRAEHWPTAVVRNGPIHRLPADHLRPAPGLPSSALHRSATRIYIFPLSDRRRFRRILVN